MRTIGPGGLTIIGLLCASCVTERTVRVIRTLEPAAVSDLSCSDVVVLMKDRGPHAQETVFVEGCGKRATYVCDLNREGVRVTKNDGIRVHREDVVCALGWIEAR